ncbi:SHOCT domain-containing protein [Mangrovactinospora gilvigrisea]|uniref:SHOCT domain-containing protein n=1 Tax=Mangrovactinospora gilvigrisea TaxID=1428644 RepID=UPI0009A117D7|nr:SHOCT domain-containing protein [Mangrovactinospora gilvigrisea]
MQDQPPVRPAAVPPAPGSASGVAERLTRLGEMLDRGLLTPEEFGTAKAALLR